MSASTDARTAATTSKWVRVPFGSREFYVSKLEEVLEVVGREPLPFAVLRDRLRTIWLDADRQLVLERLEQLAAPVVQSPLAAAMTLIPRRLPEGQQEQLAKVLAQLVAKAEVLPARDRDRADRAVARLSRLLSDDRAWTVVEPWLPDRRAFRSSVVVRVLLGRGVPPSLADVIVGRYRAALDLGVLDRGLLKLIGRNPHVAALLEDDLTRKALAIPGREHWIGDYFLRDDDAFYWRMRAIEAQLIGGRVLEDTIAFDQPMAFVWAVGRQSHYASLPLLRRVLEHHRTDPECVWRCLRAFERVGEAGDVERGRALALSIVETEQA